MAPWCLSQVNQECGVVMMLAVNSSVFSRLLKVRKVSAERVCMFREFHTLGATTGKAREENTVVAGGCCSNKAEVDRRFLIGRYL